MAKRQHWLVAIEAAPNPYGAAVVNYRVYVGREPQRTKRGDWPENRRYTPFRVRQLEAIRPPERRPELGGGPMLLGCW